MGDRDEAAMVGPVRLGRLGLPPQLDPGDGLRALGGRRLFNHKGVGAIHLLLRLLLGRDPVGRRSPGNAGGWVATDSLEPSIPSSARERRRTWVGHAGRGRAGYHGVVAFFCWTWPCV